MKTLDIDMNKFHPYCCYFETEPQRIEWVNEKLAEAGMDPAVATYEDLGKDIRRYTQPSAS